MTPAPKDVPVRFDVIRLTQYSLCRNQIAHKKSSSSFSKFDQVRKELDKRPSPTGSLIASGNTGSKHDETSY